MGKIKSVIRDCISSSRNLFEDVMRRQNTNTISADKPYKQYTILDYERMVKEMYTFIDEYVAYKESGNEIERYKGKVLPTAVAHYSNFFYGGGERYRIILDIKEFKSMNKAFLKESKHLQDIIEKYSQEEKYTKNKELQSLLEITNNQYKKVHKVFVDDIKIYIWLTSRDTPLIKKTLSPNLILAFKDITTPVIHERTLTSDNHKSNILKSKKDKANKK